MTNFTLVYSGPSYGDATHNYIGYYEPWYNYKSREVNWNYWSRIEVPAPVSYMGWLVLEYTYSATGKTFSAFQDTSYAIVKTYDAESFIENNSITLLPIFRAGSISSLYQLDTIKDLQFGTLLWL